MSRAPSIKGRQLLRLLIADGWEYVRDAPHGKWLRKRFRNETRFTTIKDDNAVIPAGTLRVCDFIAEHPIFGIRLALSAVSIRRFRGICSQALSAILGPKQTGLGRRGLRRLIEGHS